MTSLALPTRRDEAWRYSDLEAVASVWPIPAPERIEVAAGDGDSGGVAVAVQLFVRYLDCDTVFPRDLSLRRTHAAGGHEVVACPFAS